MNLSKYSKFKILFLIIAIFFLWQILKFFPLLHLVAKTETDLGSDSSSNLAPVLVSVFYEALCPDSKNFIVKHLLPTVNKASRLLNVSLVPYGKAKTEETPTGDILFSCQHGPMECLANKIHACAISKISNKDVQVKFISCMIYDNMIPELIGEKCAKELLINWEPILQCSKSKIGSLLLVNHGKKTNLLKPKISFVPTVLLNGKHGDQAAILKNFFAELCSIFNDAPVECSQLL